MKKLTVVAAGLGWNVLERNGRTELAGLSFLPKASVFPAVTCVAQASLRTGLPVSEHGIVSNGWWSEALVRPLFWEQSAQIVRGQRVWSERRVDGEQVGLYFFQQSLGESADAIVSPAPIHKHGGGMKMSCYVKPGEITARLERRCGTFPLWRYWGPLASPRVGRSCIDWFEAATDIQDVDEAYLYLPTLDYAAQRNGPGSRQDRAAFVEFCRQVERLADICQKRGCEMSVEGDYDITPVTREPVAPNLTLRLAGMFAVRTIGGRLYPDFHQSWAFAMCDHECCVLYGPSRGKAYRLLLATGDYEPSRLPNVLLAKEGSWCEYKWWMTPREAPDYARHIDIHNKPGFDPTELFPFRFGRVRGTHGRQCVVAIGK